MSDAPREPKFKLGDVVRHLASGEKAVVIEPRMTCATHNPHGLFGIAVKCCLRPAECNFRFAGQYCLDLGFHAKSVYCSEEFLELIPTELSTRKSSPD